MRDIGFNVLNKNNGIIKWERSVLYKGSSFDEDHTELYIKHITLSIYHLSCQVWSAGGVNMPVKRRILYIGEQRNLGQAVMH